MCSNRIFNIFIFVTFLNVCGFCQHLFKGDGSDEAGFVPPPVRKEIPPAPANMAGGETLIPYPPPPATPAARTEKKMPPRPPVRIIKLKSEHGEQDWNARPNDVNNLLKKLKKDCDVDGDYECLFLSEIKISPLPHKKEENQ